jgi:hypothetical protein
MNFTENAFFNIFIHCMSVVDLIKSVFCATHITANKGGGDQPAASPSTDAQPTGDIEKA